MEFIKSIKANRNGFIIATIISFICSFFIYVKFNQPFPDLNLFLMYYIPIVPAGVFFLMCFFIMFQSWGSN